jgi:hypothetical protein
MGISFSPERLRETASVEQSPDTLEDGAFMVLGNSIVLRGVVNGEFLLGSSLSEMSLKFM